MAERTLINLYIQATVQEQIMLEALLRKYRYDFYDASKFDDYCNDGSNLVDVERELEGK